jgi:hypothetical protein
MHVAYNFDGTVTTYMSLNTNFNPTYGASEITYLISLTANTLITDNIGLYTVTLTGIEDSLLI